MSESENVPADDGQDASATPRRALINRLRADGAIRTDAVAAAFDAVHRHLFVPDVSLEQAYSNAIVHIKHSDDGASISCASQPSIVAMMLEQLDLRPGHRVLELGAGTGYNAALLAHMVGEQGHVVTVDVDDDLVDGARAHLADAGATTVDVVLGDGALGHPARAPYDRIIATVGAHRIPEAWFDQLVPGGRLVVPVRIAGDVSRSIVVEADGDHWRSIDSQLCTFMPLRGGVDDDPRRVVDLTGDGAVVVQVNQDQEVNGDLLCGILNEARYEVWTDVAFGGGQSLDPMWLWLALTLDNSLSRMPVKQPVNGLTPMFRWGSMAGIDPDGQGLAYLTLRPVEGIENRHQVGVIGHADIGKILADQMAAEITAWEAYRDKEITFALHPSAATTPPSAPGRFVLSRGDARLVVSWDEST